MEIKRGPYYFPASVGGFKLPARRVLVVASPHSLWNGPTFEHYRESPDAKRAHALMMFVVEATIRSNNVGCFETVYDSVYDGIGMKRVVFLRFWVFLDNDERADAFTSQCQHILSPEDAPVPAPSSGKNKKPKRKRQEELPAMGAHLMTDPRELARALVQQKMSHVDETMSVTFDPCGGTNDLGNFDLDADDDAADDWGTEQAPSDPGSSILARLSADSYFGHEITMLAMKSNRVSAADRDLSTYLTISADGTSVFSVADTDRQKRFKMVDARVTSSGCWLASAQDLLSFKLPHFEPSTHELTQWLLSQASIIGITASELNAYDAGDLHSRVNELMLCPALYAPIPAIATGAASGASSWSDRQYESVYPANAEWMSTCIREADTILRAVELQQLSEEEISYNETHVINELDMFTSTPLHGWPPGYANVRQSTSQDIVSFNNLIASTHTFGRDTSMACMFINDACPDDMSLQTFCMVQFVELQRCEFGLDRPQSHMNSVIYPWAFVLLVPAFGYPGSIQARGPPGSGKGESKKRLQPCVNCDMWFNVDSISDQATTYGGGLPDMSFWDMDENTSQGRANGSTLTQQTTDSNGISKRARANAELKQTECIPQAVRHVNLGSYNMALPDAMQDRAVDIDLPRSLGEVRTNMTSGAPYIAACYRILTGLSAWVWLFNMAGLFTFEETLLDTFTGLNTVLLPESKLAGHARTKEAVRILSIGITVFEIVSMYYRLNPGPIAENTSHSLLAFIRDNAMLSPSAIWESYLLITTGQDPRRDPKVLSILKENLNRQSGGTYEKSDDELYYVTQFVKPSADVEPKAFITAADTCGLGQAIAVEGLQHLLQLKDADTGHRVLRLHTESAGSSRQRYQVLMTAVTTLSVLTETETALLECLSQAVAAGKALISADETQYVFKEDVRSSILTPKGSDPMEKYGRSDIMAADDSLQHVKILGYESASGLVKDVAVVHPTRLPTSQLATVGGPLDPTGAGVYYGTMCFGQVLACDTEGLHAYERQRDGETESESEAASKKKKLGVVFFKACGARPGERIFAGVGGADAVHALFTLPEDDPDDNAPIVIHNPRYTQRANRITKSVSDPNESVFFKRTMQTVSVHSELNLCRKINGYNRGRYTSTAESRAYNYP